MDYQKITIDDIIAYCKEHGQVKWLKEVASRKVEYKVYPKIEKNGKMVSDKKAEPTIEMRPISFIQIKIEFVNKFMPEIAPKAQKKESMYDKIMAL